MQELLAAFGRGVVKVVISLVFGVGVGLLSFGLAASGQEDIWHRGDPPGEMFLGVGAGLLTTGLTMVLLFFVLPRFQRTDSLAQPPAKPPSAWHE